MGFGRRAMIANGGRSDMQREDLMRFGRSGNLHTEDVGIELPGGIKVKADGWDVLLIVGLIALALNFLLTSLQPWGLWAAVVFLVLWVVLSIARPKKA